MGTRLELHEALVEILGSRNVYYQPPETLKLVYPCIIYKRSTPSVKFANDLPYIYNQRYSVTIIDKNPDSPILEKMNRLPHCSFDRHFTSDNLNHDIYNLYY